MSRARTSFRGVALCTLALLLAAPSTSGHPLRSPKPKHHKSLRWTRPFVPVSSGSYKATTALGGGVSFPPGAQPAPAPQPKAPAHNCGGLLRAQDHLGLLGWQMENAPAHLACRRARTVIERFIAIRPRRTKTVVRQGPWRCRWWGLDYPNAECDRKSQSITAFDPGIAWVRLTDEGVQINAGLLGGPWFPLAHLKTQLVFGQGTQCGSSAITSELLFQRPGNRLIYASGGPTPNLPYTFSGLDVGVYSVCFHVQHFARDRKSLIVYSGHVRVTTAIPGPSEPTQTIVTP